MWKQCVHLPVHPTVSGLGCVHDTCRTTVTSLHPAWSLWPCTFFIPLLPILSRFLPPCLPFCPLSDTQIVQQLEVECFIQAWPATNFLSLGYFKLLASYSPWFSLNLAESITDTDRCWIPALLLIPRSLFDSPLSPCSLFYWWKFVQQPSTQMLNVVRRTQFSLLLSLTLSLSACTCAESVPSSCWVLMGGPNIAGA